MIMGLLSRVKNLSVVDEIIRKNPFYYIPFKSFLNRSAELDFEQRKLVTKNLLRESLLSATKTPYAKKNGLKSFEIHDWPFLSKENVRDNFIDLVAERGFGVSASTSGSTGIPVELRRSFRSIAKEQASIDFVLEKVGLEPSKEVFGFFRGGNFQDINSKSTTTHKRLSRKRVLFSSSQISRKNIDQFYKAIVEQNVTSVIGYPSALGELYRHLEKENLKLDVNGIVTSSEVLSQQTRDLFHRVSNGAVIVDYYGLAERMVFSFSHEPNKHYFLFGYAYVELEYRRKDSEFDYYEVIGTSYINEKMPFVRYQTGDLVRVEAGTSIEEIEKIELGMKPFLGLEGRMVDYLITENNDKIVGMTFIPRGVRNIHRIQIVQSSLRRIEINVLAKSGYNVEDKMKILENAKQQIPDTFVIQVKEVDEMEKNSAGKEPYVLHKFKNSEENSSE